MLAGQPLRRFQQFLNPFQNDIFGFAEDVISFSGQFHVPHPLYSSLFQRTGYAPGRSVASSRSWAAIPSMKKPHIVSAASRFFCESLSSFRKNSLSRSPCEVACLISFISDTPFFLVFYVVAFFFLDPSPRLCYTGPGRRANAVRNLQKGDFQMSDEAKKILPGSTCEFLASTWLQQQDLRGKSAIEVADLYYSALTQIWEKYAPPMHTPTGRRMRSPGIKPDEL